MEESWSSSLLDVTRARGVAMADAERLAWRWKMLIFCKTEEVGTRGEPTQTSSMRTDNAKLSQYPNPIQMKMLSYSFGKFSEGMPQIEMLHIQHRIFYRVRTVSREKWLTQLRSTPTAHVTSHWQYRIIYCCVNVLQRNTRHFLEASAREEL